VSLVGEQTRGRAGELRPIDGWVTGTQVTVVKLDPEGREAARYPGVISRERCPNGWFAIEAPWELPRVETGGLIFAPGDTLVEFFSTTDYFNAFRVLAPDGSLRGIYGNVTYPTRVQSTDSGIVITWQDLYLDVVRLANGQVMTVDAEELEQSGLEHSDPSLFARIERTAAELVDLAQAERFPFHRLID
jgi:hypothetical protein